jgi:hypothetical protein
MVTMHRCHGALLLAGWLCSLAGCDAIAPRPTANSELTAQAYPHPLVESDYADERLREYTRQLEQVLANRPNPSPQEQAAAARAPALMVRPRPVPMLPFDQQDYTPAAQRNPLGGPVRAAPPILSAPGVLVSPSEASALAATAPAVASARPTTAPAGHAAADAKDPNAASQVMASYLDSAYVQAMAAKSPDDLDLQLKARLLLLAGHHDEEALQPVPGLSEQENQTVAALLRMMIFIRDHKGGPPSPEEAGKRLMALDVLRQELMRVADLEIPTIKLCTRIDSFGVYQEVTEPKFTAGQSHYMYVYCELRNFTVKQEGGVFRTYLNVQHVLYDDQGQAVLTQADKDVSDISANRRTDFFLTRPLTLSPTLPAGTYTLKVTVEDPAANKIKTATLTITLAKAG